MTVYVDLLSYALTKSTPVSEQKSVCNGVWIVYQYNGTLFIKWMELRFYKSYSCMRLTVDDLRTIKKLSNPTATSIEPLLNTIVLINVNSAW